MSTPVAQLRRLRGVLRQEREAQGLTQKEVADALDWSTSKVIRIERGPVGISVTDLKALLLQYRVTDTNRVDQLVEMARAAKRPAWWQEYRDIYPSQFINFLGLEASSIRIRQFQSLLVPGLLQIPDYARALMAATMTDAERIQRGVNVRMERQQLRTPDGPELFFILDESVLLRQIGDAEVMRDQLRQLVDLSAEPNITLQVLPFAAGIHRGMSSSFEIFELSDEENDFAVLIEQPYEDTLLDEPSEATRQYVNIFMEMEKIALPPDRSVELIERAITRIGGAS
jgi:transcriptional regulator with XRE-family HTH domain